MITLLSGENDFDLTRKLAQLRADFDGVAERLDASELTTEQLANVFAGQTLFAVKRLVILDMPSANKDLWSHLETWADRLSDETHLVLVEPKPDKRTSTFKWLKKHSDVHEFTALNERDLRGLTKWVESYAKGAGLKLTTQQANRLATRVGANQWELAHAIDKLALADEVTDDWIDDVSKASSSENVFALFETVLNGDIPRLHTMLMTLRQTEDPYRVLGLINSQALQLTALIYGEGEVSRVAADTNASSSYPFQKLAPFAKRLGKAQVRDMIEVLASADIRLKSSDADPWIVLESAVSQMASLSFS